MPLHLPFSCAHTHAMIPFLPFRGSFQVTACMIAFLNDDELCDLGVSSIGARVKLRALVPAAVPTPGIPGYTEVKEEGEEEP